ncbi:hypothetical protein P3L10_013669 [Capsicum annuum]
MAALTQLNQLAGSVDAPQRTGGLHGQSWSFGATADALDAFKFKEIWVCGSPVEIERRVYNQLRDQFFFMDPKYTAETLNHLEKERELLSMPIKLCLMNYTDFRVEEEMLMRKFHELMSAHGLAKKEGALVNMTNGADERQNGWEAALVDMTDDADERQNDLEGAVS